MFRFFDMTQRLKKNESKSLTSLIRADLPIFRVVALGTGLNQDKIIFPGGGNYFQIIISVKPI
jgi:hypothetical protein